MRATELNSRAKCTDLRDKVYGLLALVHPSQRIEIDYTLSAQDVCIRALHRHLDAVIKGEDELDIHAMQRLIIYMKLNPGSSTLKEQERAQIGIGLKWQIAQLQACDLAWQRLQNLPKEEVIRMQFLRNLFGPRGIDDVHVDDWLRKAAAHCQREFGYEDGGLLPPAPSLPSITRMFWPE